MADDLLRFRRTERLQFEQTIPARFKPSPNFLPGGAGLFQEVGQFGFGLGTLCNGKFQSPVVDGPAKLPQQLVSAFEVTLKRVQAFVIQETCAVPAFKMVFQRLSKQFLNLFPIERIGKRLFALQRG